MADENDSCAISHRGLNERVEEECPHREQWGIVQMPRHRCAIRHVGTKHPAVVEICWRR